MSSPTSEKAKQKISTVLYGRSIVIIVLILLQIGFFVYGLTMVREYFVFIYGVFIIIGIIAVIHIINSERNPEFQITWMLCIMAMPFIGTFFYVYTRANLGKRMIGKRLTQLKIDTAPYMVQDPQITSRMKSSKLAHAGLSTYLAGQLNLPTYGNTKLEYYPIGEAKFKALVRELKKAKKFIFMEYFIVEEGEMWRAILDILKEKAQDGVEVRFMYDGMCSLTMLPYDYPQTLQKMGIQCKMFNPLKPVVSTIQNNRDHRKICVIDGLVGFTGGVNIGDEYINRKVRFGHWKDTAIMLKGDAVLSLTVMFLQMWNITEKKTENYKRYLIPPKDTFDRSLGYVLPYMDSPYDNEDVAKEVYLHILNHAKNYVHITTPYLIPDSETLKALIRAAKSGVEVVIIMPHIPDKQYAFDLAKTYYAELIKNGVQIYEYTPGFVHAKIFVSDDDTATVGTVNLDYRSLYLHFECGVFIYHSPEVYYIEKDFQDTLKKCHKVTMTEVRNRSLLSKIKGQVLKLVAPLM